MSKRTVTAATLAASTALLAACGGGSEDRAVPDDCEPAHEFETISEGKLTVAAVELPPFLFVEGNELSGVDGDVLTEFAAQNCLDLTVEPLTSAASIPAIQAGRADVAAGAFYRTSERAAVVDLSDPIYSDQMAIIGPGATGDISALQGEAVGTVDGYLWVADMREYLGDSLQIYNTAQNLYQDLEAGRITVAVDSFGSGAYSTEGDDVEVVVADPLEEVAASLDGAQIAFPVPKGREDFLTALNETIVEMRENGDLAESLVANGLDASAADPGEARLIGE